MVLVLMHDLFPEFVSRRFGHLQWTKLQESEIFHSQGAKSMYESASLLLGAESGEIGRAFARFFLQYESIQSCLNQALRSCGFGLLDAVVRFNDLQQLLAYRDDQIDNAPDVWVENVHSRSFELHYQVPGTAYPPGWVEGLLEELAPAFSHGPQVVTAEWVKGTQDGSCDHEVFLVTAAPSCTGSFTELVESRAERLHGCTHTLSPSEFARIFSFQLLIDTQCRVVQAGDALLRLHPGLMSGNVFAGDYFKIVCSSQPSSWDYEWLVRHAGNSSIMLTSTLGMQLKGRFVRSSRRVQRPQQQGDCGSSGALSEEVEEVALFLGYPLVSSLSELQSYGLVLSDFHSGDLSSDWILAMERMKAEMVILREINASLEAEREDLVLELMRLKEVKILDSGSTSQLGLMSGTCGRLPDFPEEGSMTERRDFEVPANRALRLLERFMRGEGVSLMEVEEAHQALLLGQNDIRQQMDSTNLNDFTGGDAEVNQSLMDMLGPSRAQGFSLMAILDEYPEDFDASMRSYRSSMRGSASPLQAYPPCSSQAVATGLDTSGNNMVPHNHNASLGSQEGERASQAWFMSPLGDSNKEMARAKERAVASRSASRMQMWLEEGSLREPLTQQNISHMLAQVNSMEAKMRKTSQKKQQVQQQQQQPALTWGPLQDQQQELNDPHADARSSGGEGAAELPYVLGTSEVSCSTVANDANQAQSSAATGDRQLSSPQAITARNSEPTQGGKIAKFLKKMKVKGPLMGLFSNKSTTVGERSSDPKSTGSFMELAEPSNKRGNDRRMSAPVIVQGEVLPKDSELSFKAPKPGSFQNKADSKRRPVRSTRSTLTPAPQSSSNALHSSHTSSLLDQLQARELQGMSSRMVRQHESTPNSGSFLKLAVGTGSGMSPLLADARMTHRSQHSAVINGGVRRSLDLTPSRYRGNLDSNNSNFDTEGVQAQSSGSPLFVANDLSSALLPPSKWSSAGKVSPASLSPVPVLNTNAGPRGGIAAAANAALAVLQTAGDSCEVPPIDVATNSIVNPTGCLLELYKSPSDELAEVMSHVDEWQFDIFALEQATNGRPLSYLAFNLIQRLKCPPAMGIDSKKLCNFLIQVENNYQPHPYHNWTHAADVLRNLHVITTRGGVLSLMMQEAYLVTAAEALATPQKSQVPPLGSEAFRDKNLSPPGNNISSGSHPPANTPTGASSQTPKASSSNTQTVLTMLTIYFAAIIHDFEHRGVNNQFLINSEDLLALRYNDMSPMENHHAAAAFTLLKQSPFNFMERMPRKMRLALRSQVIDMVLATDMKQHFASISTFNSRFSSVVMSPRREPQVTLRLSGKQITTPTANSGLATSRMFPRAQQPWACSLDGTHGSTVGLKSKLSKKRLMMDILGGTKSLPSGSPIQNPSDVTASGSSSMYSSAEGGKEHVPSQMRPATHSPNLHQIAHLRESSKGEASELNISELQTTASSFIPESEHPPAPRLDRNSSSISHNRLMASPEGNESGRSHHAPTLPPHHYSERTSGGGSHRNSLEQLGKNSSARQLLTKMKINMPPRLAIVSDNASDAALLSPYSGHERDKSQNGCPSISIDDEARILIWKMALKCADLGHLCGPRDVHIKWVRQLEEEMFRQGDRERSARMAISPLMDRLKGGITKSQPGFFNVVVLPLFSAFVGVFPSMLPLLSAVKENLRFWQDIDERGADVATAAHGAAAADMATAADGAAAADMATAADGAGAAEAYKEQAQE